MRARFTGTLMCMAVTALAHGSTASGPSYRLDVRLDPAGGAIDCVVEIRSPRASTFSLARDLKIRRILADGQAVAFREEPSGPSEATRKVRLDSAPPARLAIEYSGRILPESYPPVVSEVNRIGPGLAELAGYVGWYPRLDPPASFAFHLSVDAPGSFVTVVNGRPAGPGQRSADRVVTEWESYEPTSDIVLLSAPGLRKTEDLGGGVRVELYSASLPKEYADSMRDDVGRAVELLSGIVGAPSPTRVVRVVYSPRPGWGYVRTPLIVVSEAKALAMREQRFGRERDWQYLAHETAHYWWHLADSGTPEDWINEGFAEYMAFLASGRLMGGDFAATLLEEYRERSSSSATHEAIAETTGDSPDREVNRYARPVLLLDEARQKYGDDRMVAFIRALYQRFSESGPATTAAFLDEAGRSLGPEARTFFSEALHRRVWSDSAATKAYVLSPREAVYLGTWTGSLTQAGATNTVVLHLVARDGVLTASLDSPDQGVRDIPVPTVRLSEGSLYFALGNFGVSYRGVLSPDTRTIEGEWSQGGAASPLRLTRADRPE